MIKRFRELCLGFISRPLTSLQDMDNFTKSAPISFLFVVDDIGSLSIDECSTDVFEYFLGITPLILWTENVFVKFLNVFDCCLCCC